jgi:hypothetical protein
MLGQRRPQLRERDPRLGGRELPQQFLLPRQQRPPIFAGAMLPVVRTRRISVTAADELTSKRRAAARAELPPATARTSRWRKSADRGAVIVASSPLLQPQPRALST